jgi:rubredoxin/uncharacterized membrane protein
MKKWRCTVCGYIHSGDEPPEKCPVCGADKSKFVLLESDIAEPNKATTIDQDTEFQDTTIQDTTTNQELNFGRKLIAKYPIFTQYLTKYHVHPISVHLPNGVLPLTVFFTVMAAIFNSEAFAVASDINILFVFFSMPIVLFTGYIDWINRYDGTITKIFQIKIACGISVTILTAILVIWRFVQPGILLEGLSKNILFIFTHFLVLIPAVVAGFMGGKLVFKE